MERPSVQSLGNYLLHNKLPSKRNSIPKNTCKVIWISVDFPLKFEMLNFFFLIVFAVKSF